jgi:D-ribose pyranose/furanose isomerase RbsD
MKIVSIDVGIKNLALCLFEVENKECYEIRNWDVVSLCNEVVVKCSCGKLAKYCYGDIVCCKKHYKDIEYPIIPKELELQKMKKIKINDLKQLLTKHNIEFDTKKSKVLLLEYLHDLLPKMFIMPFSNTVKTTDLSLIEIGINLKKTLDELYGDIHIDTVIIENQISPIANRMKTLQGMIAQYFIMKNTTDIHFISAANKLKEYVSKKTTYSERKKMGIEICEELLINNEQFGKHLDMFHTDKKKDDLADCFLQGIWYLRDKIIYN